MTCVEPKAWARELHAALCGASSLGFNLAAEIRHFPERPQTFEAAREMLERVRDVERLLGVYFATRSPRVHTPPVTAAQRAEQKKLNHAVGGVGGKRAINLLGGRR